MNLDLLCRVCRARPVMDRCDICEECWYAPRRTCECDPLGEGLDHHPWCGRYVDPLAPMDLRSKPGPAA